MSTSMAQQQVEKNNLENIQEISTKNNKEEA
jgi:hypothetical protein